MPGTDIIASRSATMLTPELSVPPNETRGVGIDQLVSDQSSAASITHHQEWHTVTRSASHAACLSGGKCHRCLAVYQVTSVGRDGYLRSCHHQASNDLASADECREVIGVSGVDVVRLAIYLPSPVALQAPEPVLDICREGPVVGRPQWQPGLIVIPDFPSDQMASVPAETDAVHQFAKVPLSEQAAPICGDIRRSSEGRTRACRASFR